VCGFYFFYYLFFTVKHFVTLHVCEKCYINEVYLLTYLSVKTSLFAWFSTAATYRYIWMPLSYTSSWNIICFVSLRFYRCIDCLSAAVSGVRVGVLHTHTHTHTEIIKLIYGHVYFKGRHKSYFSLHLWACVYFAQLLIC